VFSNEDYLLELLVEAGVVDQGIVDQTEVGDQKTPGQRIISLIQSRQVSEEQVVQVMASNSGVEFIDLANAPIPPDIFEKMTAEEAKRFRAIPVADDGVYLTVAVADVLDFEALDSLPHLLGRDLNFLAATPSGVAHVLKANYGLGDEEVSDVDINKVTIVTSEGGEDVTENDAPVIRLVSGVLRDAFQMGASDIHMEPMETSLRVRFRVDGKLHEAETHPKNLLPAVIARIKVMSGSMKVSEKRVPQDGRIQMRVGGKEVDLRVSTVPSNHGESVVMRILDKSALMVGLPQLGFFSDDQSTIQNLLGLPDGIILVTGPTGSGKTTTLYSCLNHINKPDKKIITVEDPVEYELAGINQVMVKTDIGMTFAAALRAMLRQAPNIIMVGEIRDAETAGIAINAALTGHLVFSTLHTNDAPSAVARLADIGVKRFLIASSVRAIMAQRLVRKLCDGCKTAAILDDKQMRALNMDPTQMTRGTIMGPEGCDVCSDRGYRGRMGIFEIFKVDDEVRHLVNDENLSAPQLRKRARELGMRTLREDGIRKLLAGVTSAEEVISVTMSDND